MSRAFFPACAQKNRVCASDYPVSEPMKLVCTVNASGTVTH